MTFTGLEITTSKFPDIQFFRDRGNLFCLFFIGMHSLDRNRLPSYYFDERWKQSHKLWIVSQNTHLHLYI